MSMITGIKSTIEKYKMLSSGDHVLLGLSGGADSVCLLRVLLDIRQEYELKISAVHVNHGLRGAEADADQIFAEKLCEGFGVAIYSRFYDIRAIANKDKITEEEAGRNIRYSAFREIAALIAADKIAIAHNENDNAETVLMRLARGTGLKGLGGIPPVRDNIIRPLIETPREKILLYLSEKNQLYVTDASNHSDIYTRNKIRRIVGLLKEEINPRTVRSISKTAELLREEEAFLQELTHTVWEGIKLADDNRLCLSIDGFARLHDVMKRRVLRYVCLQTRPGLYDLSAGHIQKLMDLAEKPTGKIVCLPFGVRVSREYDRLVFDQGETAGGYCYSFFSKAAELLPEGEEWVEIPEIRGCISMSAEKILQRDGYKCLCTKKINCDKINGILQIRTRKPGDRINIKKVGGKKIKDYFIDHKLPRFERETTALIADQNEIIWILDSRNIVHSLYEVSEGVRGVYLQRWERLDV